VKTNAGAILLFDFRAAFPSMDHSFMWETLEAVGFPTEYIKALKQFYTNNKHFMQVGGDIFPSVMVESGVRQGCPISPLLFVICADILLRELGALTSGEELVRAFADDTAMVVEDYTRSLPILARKFSEFERISGLALNIRKTVFIPLWCSAVGVNLRTLVRESCPAWRDIRLDSKGKYLGFFIGPGAGTLSWERPVRKFVERAEVWSTLHLGFNLNVMVYDSFIASVLSYVMQVEEPPSEVYEHFEKVLRKLAPGPGNWCSTADLLNLKRVFHFPRTFRDPRWTALAAKLRVIEYIAPDFKERVRELEEIQTSYFRRPCRAWQQRCYFTVLSNASAVATRRGIDRRTILRELAPNTSKHLRCKSFRRTAEQLICQRLSPVYYEDARLRAKLHRWHLEGIPAHNEQRVLQNFATLSQWCQPKVLAAYFRTLWTGWTTDRRMAPLRKEQGLPIRGCLLGCGWDEDSLEHYATCSFYWEFMCQRRPYGMGLPILWRSREMFFIVAKGLADDDKCRLALGIYALHRTVSSCRHIEASSNIKAMLRLWTRIAAENSNAKQLLY
jgi:hypothetical protein